LLREALEEERVRSEASLQQAVERTQEQVQAKMEDMAKVMSPFLAHRRLVFRV
jgi:hypothetical protein